MAKHGGNGGKGKNDTTEDGAKISVRGQGQGQKLMSKHGGNGGKGKNGTTKEGAKISESRARARARAKIDDKTWRKGGKGQKRPLKLR